MRLKKLRNAVRRGDDTSDRLLSEQPAIWGLFDGSRLVFRIQFHARLWQIDEAIGGGGWRYRGSETTRTRAVEKARRL